ncbi:MAG TPA: hypothetical protein DIU00_20680 [Phycisphaerales bacterium]|nr:hypothetical protein [Phycisphaerales bacterium]
MDNSKIRKILFYAVLFSFFVLFGRDMQAQGISVNPLKSVADSRFSEEGFLKVGGASRLIIGLYELPNDDDRLAEIAESGFNLVRVPQERKALDRLREHGLYAWICLGSAVKLKDGNLEGEQKLERIIDQFKSHPSFLVWELSDEALWNVWWSRFPWIFGEQQRQLRGHIEKARGRNSQADTGKLLSLLREADDYDERALWKKAEAIYDTLWEKLGVKNPHPDWKMSQCPARADELIDKIARGCRAVRRFDAGHIIWQNHAPRNTVVSMRKYNRAVDAAGCDIYPVPFSPTSGHSDLKDTNLSSVGAYTDRMRQAAPGKSIWMVLQGFGWRDLSEDGKNDPDLSKGRRPRFNETRFMAYDAVVHGANAVLYWGTHSIEKDSSLWRNLMKTAKELRALEPGIVGERPVNPPLAVADETYGSVDEKGPVLMLRKTGQDWVLIAVNEHSQGISFKISKLPEELEGRNLYRLYSDEVHLIENGRLHDGIRGFGVHVYATSRRFENE